MAVSSLSAVHVVTMASKMQDRPNLDVHNVLTSRGSDFQPLPQISLRFSLAVSLYPTRVVVKISHIFKHNLSVEQTWAWQHRDDIAGEGDGCSHVKGCLVQNYKDVLDCLTESSCRVEDNRL